jgi:hypothetical protein
MKNLLFLYLFFLILVGCAVQPTVQLPFEGKIVYKIKADMLDEKAIDSSNFQVVYAKDSMLRVENFTPIGKQIYIKHIPNNRAYILMDVFTEKLAIRSIPEAPPNAGKYVFTSNKKTKKIAGKKAKQVLVNIPDIDSTFTMYFYPDIPAHYSEAIPGIEGLPAKFTIYSNGIYFDYEVVYIESFTTARDLFGIPSDHRTITMDEFIEIIQENE